MSEAFLNTLRFCLQQLISLLINSGKTADLAKRRYRWCTVPTYDKKICSNMLCFVMSGRLLTKKCEYRSKNSTCRGRELVFLAKKENLSESEDLPMQRDFVTRTYRTDRV